MAYQMGQYQRLVELLELYSPAAACKVLAEELDIHESMVIWWGHEWGVFTKKEVGG